MNFAVERVTGLEVAEGFATTLALACSIACGGLRNILKSPTRASSYPFHLYRGNRGDPSRVHDAHPGKHIYFTDRWVGAPGNPTADVSRHVKTLIIGGSWNWCRNVLNRILHPTLNQNPHSLGGHSECLGAVTISGNAVTRNPASYIMAHAARFLRTSSASPTVLPTVAFGTPDGKSVLIVFNDGQVTQAFKISLAGTILV